MIVYQILAVLYSAYANELINSNNGQYRNDYDK